MMIQQVIIEITQSLSYINGMSKFILEKVCKGCHRNEAQTLRVTRPSTGHVPDMHATLPPSQQLHYIYLAS